MRFALFLSYWGVVENLRAKPPMMLGGRVGKDIRERRGVVENLRAKPPMMLGGRVGIDIKRKGGRGEDYHNKK
jgi:hypothetical protein